MAQPVNQPETLSVEQMKEIARETLHYAAQYLHLYAATQEQLRQRGVLIADTGNGQWGVMLKTPPRQSRRFDNVGDALAYAFELYEASHE